ncbi:MAG TPA: ABC transporter permease, partial [Achromobacter sp.]|nr:ABC transporter permease [Achromobacter sp.]
MSSRSSSRETRLIWVSALSLLGFLLLWEGLCRAGAV